MSQGQGVSRRQFVQQGTALAAALSLSRTGIAGVRARRHAAGVRQTVPLNLGWEFREEAASAAWQPANLPHCVAPLSWHDWKVDSWEKVWRYRRQFDAAALENGGRAFLSFGAVMQKATPTLNGGALEEHLGGFLPFEREVTSLLKGRNELEVLVDSRWLNVPPGGAPQGPSRVDYMLPGGITRDVSLEFRPESFIADVFAKPVHCLEANRAVAVQCSIDSKAAGPRSFAIRAELLDGTATIAHEQAACSPLDGGVCSASLMLGNLGNVGLWSPDTPRLYTVKVTLLDGNRQLDSYAVRIGFREARFTTDGFFLNGAKSHLFGLNRHELFPYVGFAMPDNVMRRDAEMLRHEFHCNTVRCSHYPQSEAFLDACDELGLMVWEEMPGWQYLGDEAWRALAVRDAGAMIRRDRNHPAIIIWGTRINESNNDVELYQKTNAVARSLDDSRPLSGSMTSLSTKGWIQEVFAFDDYHARPDGSVAMAKPINGVPFMFAEAVGQFGYSHGNKGFHQYYRRAGDRETFEEQALFHAQGQDRGISDPRSNGVIAWCAFDYASLVNPDHGIKCPGIADVFRIPKFGAAFYASQISPAKKVVIEPSFFWDFADGHTPGNDAHIYSNCEQLVVMVGDEAPVHLLPQREAFPNLAYAPFKIDLSKVREGKPELRIDGYVDGKVVATRRFSSDRSLDKLISQADESTIAADGLEATRVFFRAVDRYGAPAPCVDGTVSLVASGPAQLIGDTSFDMQLSGGVGAVWVRSRAGQPGTATLSWHHPRLGSSRSTVHIAHRRA